MKKVKLYQATRGSVRAGFVVTDGWVTRYAPILRVFVQGSKGPHAILRLRVQGFQVRRITRKEHK